MSALAIAAETFTPLTDQCLRTIVEKFSGQDFTLEDLKNDEDLIKFMAPPKGKKKSKAKKVTPTERATSDYECHQCDARVWEKGYGGQCSRKKVDGECMCQMHLNHVAKEGKWWLGLVTEPRPEELEHPSGRPHAWKITTEGEEIVKEKKSPKKSSPKASGEKKKPGRPKGSKNKKKSADEEKDAEIAALKAQIAAAQGGVKEEVVEEKILPKKVSKNDSAIEKAKEAKEQRKAKLEEMVEEEDVASEATQAYEDGDGFDEDGNKDIVYEGVKYKLDRDGDVIDPEDFSCVGTWDADEQIITFNGEDEEAAHEAKK